MGKFGGNRPKDFRDYTLKEKRKRQQQIVSAAILKRLSNEIAKIGYIAI